MDPSPKQHDEPSVEVTPSSSTGARGLEALLDPLPGAWYFSRPDGSFAFASLGACQWLGYTRGEMQELRIFDIDPQVTPESWRGIWKSTRPPDSLTVRTVHRRKDGRQSPVEVRAVRAYINGEDLAVSCAVDLTQSEETRAALVSTQAELKRLLDHVPDLIFRMQSRPTPRFSFASPSSMTLLGYMPDELTDDGTSVSEIVHPDDLPHFLALDRTPPGVGRRIRFLHRRGHIVWMELRVTPLASTMEGLAIEGVARDVTASHEREQLQEQLHQAQKMEAVGQLAGGIAHDFNNLLQVIQGHTHLVRSMSRDARVDGLLMGVLGATERASRLIRQLLSFSRSGTVGFSELELGQIIASLHQMLERLMGDNVRLIWSCRVSPVHVIGNAAQLEQLVVNLCINARDALPKGGDVHLTLDCVTAQALPAAARGHLDPAAVDFVRLTISDDGEGMSPEVQSRLFEPFFTTKAPGKGTGLGLSTVYAAVRAHRGYIDFSSTLGQGTTFRVFLPRVLGTPLPRRPTHVARPVRGGGRLALVAEDEPDVLRLTATYLMQAGFTLLTARDGEAAEHLLLEGGTTIAVAVLDVVMPKKSGLNIYDTLRARGLLTPIVFVTGYDDELLAAAAKEPTVAVLQKPFDRDELLAKIALVTSSEPAAKLAARTLTQDLVQEVTQDDLTRPR